MAALIGLFVGGIIGKLAFGDREAVLFAIVGFVVGAFVSRSRDRDRFRKPRDEALASGAGVPATLASAAPQPLAERVAALERRVAELERAAAGRARATAEATSSAPPPLDDAAPRPRALPRRRRSSRRRPHRCSPQR